MTELQNYDENNVIKLKSDKFADRIIKLHQYLKNQKQEYILSKQVLRSGTSVGANISEALFATSKKDFLLKLKISEKELSETIFWLGRLKNGDYLNKKEFDSINTDAFDIKRILSAIIRTTKNNLSATIA